MKHVAHLISFHEYRYIKCFCASFKADGCRLEQLMMRNRHSVRAYLVILFNFSRVRYFLRITICDSDTAVFC